MLKNRNISPWLWVPTLYFAEGIPYFVVNNISVSVFTSMGVPNGEMSLFTSLLYLPWVIKPIWSPFVDVIKSKRWWIVTMQILMTAMFVGLALSLPSPEAQAVGSHSVPISAFTVTLIIFWITAFASATHDIAADGFYMHALDTHSQSVFVGIRSLFYRISSVFGQGVLVMIAGKLMLRTDVTSAWTITLILTSVLFGAISLWHSFSLPSPESDGASAGSATGKSVSGIFRGFGQSFLTFFSKKGVVIAIIFMLLYRLPEALSLKLLNPFFIDPLEQGGLGKGMDDYGLLYGTSGVVALIAGGILGGLATGRWGLKKCLWPMALSLALPCSVYLFLAIVQPSSLWLIGTCVAVDQFGYGFGFTAYMVYMMYFSQGEFKTSHYAICTAFMALSMMVPGLFAGFLQETLGYVGFFVLVMACCLATVGVTFLIKVDPEYGKK